jgi:hypothetical protein
VVARALGSGRTLFDGNLRVGERATLVDDAAACLPNKVEMSITSPVNRNIVHQRLVVDTRCRAGGLRLTDSAGSLDFIAYTCRNGDIHNCTADVVFDTCSRNTGTSFHELTNYTLDFDGQVTDFLTGRTPRVLRGGAYCTEEVRTIDTCAPSNHSASVRVEANRNRCNDSELLSFDVNVSGVKPQSQNCSVDLELYCGKAGGTSATCNSIPTIEDLACDCISNCAESFKFLYTGEDCSPNLPGVTSCTDNSENNKPSKAWLTAKGEGGETLFEGIVVIGQEATLRDSAFCIPDQVTIEIRGSYQRDKIFQTLTMDTTCGGENGPMKLNDALGAVQFTGYTCAISNLARNCLTDVVFDICSTNSEQGSVDITNLTLSLDSLAVPVERNTSNLLEGMSYNMTIRSGGRQCRRTTRTINTCGTESRSYLAIANVQAQPDGIKSIVCTNSEQVQFATTTRSTRSSISNSTTNTSTAKTTQRTAPDRQTYWYQRQSYTYSRQPYAYHRQQPEERQRQWGY